MRRQRLRLLSAFGTAVLAIGLTLVYARPVATQTGPPAAPAAPALPVTVQAGPPNGLAVQVLSGTVTVAGGTVAATQSGDWNVRAIEEPYFHSIAPTCDFSNRCYVTLPAVPAGRSLRLTRIHGMIPTSSDSIVALHIDDPNATSVVFVFPAPHCGAAFYGNIISFNTDTDVIIGSGHSPVVEVGTTGSLPPSNSFSRLGVTGMLLRTQ